MITPEKFVELWTVGENELVRYPGAKVESLTIPHESKNFLVKAGLPKDAAPFLSFGCKFCKESLAPVSETWDLPESFSRYRILGSTGSGDPICIDESENGTVVCLNHDRDFERIFANSSVMQLAECLLVYRDSIERLIQDGGEDAYLEGNIPESIRARIVHEIQRIDELAIDEESFWGNELRV